MEQTEQQEKKEPFDEWLDYAFHVVLAVDLKFPREMSAVKGVIIEKALKPYHFFNPISDLIRHFQCMRDE